MIALAATTLSGCGIYTKYQSETEVDESLYGDDIEQLAYEADAESGASSTSLGSLEWRELFTDARLQSLIEEGLENNRTLQSALLQVEQAQASLKAARLSYLPSLTLSGEGSIASLPSSSASFNTYTAPLLSASWQVDIFGKLTNEKLRTKMLAEQQEYVAQATRAQLVSSIATLYYTLSMLDEQIEIAQRTELSWMESLRTARMMKDAGMMDEAGVSQIEASALSVQSALIDLRTSRNESENALTLLLGSTPRAIETSPLKGVTLPASVGVGLPLEMLSSRPDVMSAESALAASFYSENVARTAFYPSLTISASGGFTNSLGSVITNPGEFIVTAVGQLVQPIFNRGLNRAQLEIAKSQFEQSRLSFEQQLLTAGVEVNDALTAMAATKDKSPLLQSQVLSLERAAHSTQLLMTHGSTTYLEVLTAQQTLYNAELSEASNRFDQISALIALYNALGGGRF